MVQSSARRVGVVLVLALCRCGGAAFTSADVGVSGLPDVDASGADGDGSAVAVLPAVDASDDGWGPGADVRLPELRDALVGTEGGSGGGDAAPDARMCTCYSFPGDPYPCPC